MSPLHCSTRFVPRFPSAFRIMPILVITNITSGVVTLGTQPLAPTAIPCGWATTSALVSRAAQRPPNRQRRPALLQRGLPRRSQTSPISVRHRFLSDDSPSLRILLTSGKIGKKWHLVQSGDTCQKVSDLFKITLAKL